MNKGVMRAISLFMSSAMFISSLPAVMAEETEDTNTLSTLATDAAEDNDVVLMSAPQVGGYLLDMDFEDAEIGSDAGITSSDAAVKFEVIDGESAAFTTKVLKVGKTAASDAGAKINIGTLSWGSGIGERVVVTSFSAASGLLDASEEASFALAGGNSAKNVTASFRFNKGGINVSQGTGSDPKESKLNPDIKYGEKEWYRVNMVSHVDENDCITKTEYYINGDKKTETCVPNANEITGKKPDRFRVNLDKTTTNTAFYIDNLTVVDFKQEMQYIEKMIDEGTLGIPEEVLGGDNTITLPSSYRGADITWTSSDTSMINPEDADENGVVPVTHPAAPTEVKLTAIVTFNGAEGYELEDTAITSAEHEFTLTVDRGGPMNDETKLKYVLDELKLGLEQVSDNFTLPETVRNEEKDITGTVTWKSNDSAINIEGANAVVTRPGYGEADKAVKLTATVTVGDASDTKEFIVTVLKNSAPVTAEEKKSYAENELLALNFSEDGEKVVSGNEGGKVNLPAEILDKEGNKVAEITWKSSDTQYISDNGDILQTLSGGTHSLTLTATVKIDDKVYTYNYPVVLRASATVKAFPGAQGYGTQTRGGAKGYIYHVTSLGATGPGTLHEALEVKTGARTIVFDVGGTIDLTPLGRALRMSGEDDSNVTIAGQTAPGNGIQLKGYGMTLSNVHDVIIRHISIRIGNVRKAGDTYQSDPLSATGANKRVVLDHLSMCWGVDMGFRVYGNEMTMSNSMISKGLYWNTPHEKGKHNYAGIFGAKYGTLYGNYIADCGQRAPRICDNEFIDVRNNVVFNSKYTFDICNYEWMGANPKFNVVGNVVLRGNPSPGNSSSNAASGGSYKYFQGRTYSGGLFVYSANNYDHTKRDSKASAEARAINDSNNPIEGALWTGNLNDADRETIDSEMAVYNTNGFSNIKDEWKNMILPSDISLDEYDDSAISKQGNTLVNYPFVIPPMKTYSGSDTVKYVLTNAGAKAPVRGILDNRYLAEARTRLQILSDYSKASKKYGIKLDASYEGETAYGLKAETHTVYEDENGMTVYDVDGNTVSDASNMTVKDQYKFVSCENDLDTLYSIDDKGNKYRLVLRDYTDSDDIYDAFDLYDITNSRLNRPAFASGVSYGNSDTLKFNGNINMKYADWGDGAGNYDHKNSGVSDGNLDTSIVDTEWSEDDWPQLPVTYRDGDFDSNGDGIPDFFIKLMGWDKHPQYSSNKDISRMDFEGRGYTNLEYYINDYCAGDEELADSEENNVIEAENVRDGSARYNTHRSHEILFNTSRRAKAKLYYCEGETFDLSSAQEVKLNSEYNINSKLYSDPGDYDTYFSAVISNGDKGLKPDTTYTYKIKTYSDTGVECMSTDTYSFKTLAESTGKPGTPRVLKYIPYDKQITVVFEPASPAKTYSQDKIKDSKSGHVLTEISANNYDTKTDHFVLRYSENADLSNAKEVSVPVTATRYVLSGLTNDKEYYLDLRAVSADGTESDPAVYNKKKSQATGEKDKDGNDVYNVKKISVKGKNLQEYYDDYEHVFNTIAIRPTMYVVNENYKKTLKESEIGEGETTKFISIYGDEKDWYIYTLGGIPIPSIAEGDTDPMLMLRDDSHDHGFTYAKKFDTVLDGKSTIHARLMIKGETLDPMNQSPELRFYIQQDSAAEEDEDKNKGDDDSGDDTPPEPEEDEEGGDNNATTFGNIVSLQFTKNEILYNGGDSVARYEDDVWYDIKFLMDADNGTCSLYINDSLVGKDMEYSASATSNSIARWQISSRLAGTEDVYIDYMYAYKGWEEPVTDPDATPKPDNTVQEGTSGFKPGAGGGGGGGTGGGGDKTLSTPKPSTDPSETPTATNEPNGVNGENDTDNTQNNKDSHFKDMGGYEWAVEAVNELHNRGIAYGMTEELFAPGREITRAEFVTLLMRGFELIGEDASCNFEDVPDGSWYYPAVAMAYSMGIVNGYSQTMFGANDKVSRQDMAAIVTRLMSKLGFELPKVKSYESFDDDSLISEYAKDAVKELYEAGIINGVGYNQYNPLGTANRAEAAKVLYSTLKIQWDKQEQ